MRARGISEERGASAVEFAIIASLLLMILFGTVTFGITFNRIQGLQAAAREGARLGALSTTTRDDILNRVKNSVSNSIINASNIATTCAQNPPTTLTVDNGCMEVSIRPDPNTTQPGWVRYTNSTDQPCGNPPQTATAPALVVQVYYEIKIDIPLWSSPKMMITGTGEFKCEQ